MNVNMCVSETESERERGRASVRAKKCKNFEKHSTHFLYLLIGRWRFNCPWNWSLCKAKEKKHVIKLSNLCH